MSFCADMGKLELRIKNPLLRGFLGECVGTFILTTMGYAAIAQVVLCDHNLTKQHGDFTSISIAWGIGVCLAVMFAKRNGSGNLNPAVSIADTVIGKLEAIRLPIYIAAQFIGSFLGALVVYGIYYQAIDFFVKSHPSMEGNKTVEGNDKLCLSVSGVFTTFPQTHLINASACRIYFTCFLDQFFSTGLMMAFALLITDSKNLKIPLQAQAPLLGAMVTCMVSTFAANCGAPLNPARDFSPRLMLYMFSKYGFCVFRAGEYYFWVPIIACPLGAIGGAYFYKLACSNHIPNDDEVNKNCKPAENENKETASLLNVDKECKV